MRGIGRNDVSHRCERDLSSARKIGTRDAFRVGQSVGTIHEINV